ncbi:MAG: sigma-54-dependent Fis family transcriptional regulator [Planctomycetes bacterium]|nr:sigma-54-dependent Fis family transcriptional regulator [Planctomycetota bacterium]
MQNHVNVLVTEIDPAVAENIAQTLEAMGHACTVATEPEKGLKQAASGNHEVVIVNLALPDGKGWEILREARRARPEVQIIALGGDEDIPAGVKAMSEGATNYLHKPLNHTEFSIVVDRAAEYISLHRDREALQKEVSENYRLQNIVGNSQPMLKVFERIRQAAATDATVLIQGETGTGKELVARAVHYNSARSNNRFVPLNCAGLVETILESELFGHEKGAFTGATSSRVGMFEYADHGTLFLDEIGDMPLSSQVKLLRVLEHGQIVRVGSNDPIRIDVRLIAATHRNLQEKIKDNSFREDLFYRLNVVTVNLPSLRERRSDITLLADHFLRHLSEQHGKSVHGLSPKIKKFLFQYDWPGNVRELRNCLEHMIVVTTDDELGEDDLPEYLQSELGIAPERVSMESMAGQPLENVEREHIARTLELVDGNREKAAELLGIGERTLYRKIEKYDLR